MQNYNLKFKIVFHVIIFTFATLTLHFALCTLNLSNALAQETQRAITIVPPASQHTLNPGDKAEGIMKVINDSDTPLTFTATPRDYIVVDKIGTPNMLPPNTLNKQFSAAAWIGIMPNTFTVQPHQRQDLNFYIQIPNDAKPGGHYAAVVYTPTSQTTTQSSGSTVETQMGTLFYIDVNGTINEKASVIKFLSNAFQEYGPVKLTTEINNQGDLHINPKGIITVTDLFGRTIVKQPVQENNIFPTTSRDYETLVGQKWMVGPFKATINAAYGKSSALPLTATLTFWVFPWRVTLLVILIIVAVVLGIKAYKKKHQTKPSEPQKEESPTA